LFTQIDKPGVTTAAKTLQLPGEIGKFLGVIEQHEYAVVLRGDKGAGKTRLLYQIKNAFADAGFDVGSFSMEIDKKSDIVTRMVEEYISPKNRAKVQIASVAPDGLKTIKQAAKVFPVIAIDSWGKLNIPQTEFDKLRKDHPETFFIIIFQSTTAGTARGGSMAEYDAGAVIQVDTGGIAFCEKNRYANAENIDAKYSVFEKKLVKEPKQQQVLN
jgi:hypothetical protein